MHPDSIKWTGFTTPPGHFEWLVMSFGLKNAPSIFQRKMDEIFNDCADFVRVYIDDILVYSLDDRPASRYTARAGSMNLGALGESFKRGLLLYLIINSYIFFN